MGNREMQARPGDRALTAFGFAFDIERTADTSSGFKPAESDLSAQKSLFGNLRLAGFASLIRTSFAQKLIVIGGNERRYADDVTAPINRAAAICKMLADDFGVDPTQLSAIVSEPNTAGNVEALKAYVKNEGVSLINSIGVSSHYHIPRIHVLLTLAGLTLELLPAEAFTLYEAGTLHELAAQKSGLSLAFGGGSFAERVVEEIAGIAAKLSGEYARSTATA